MLFRKVFICVGQKRYFVRKLSTMKSYYHRLGKEPLSILTLGQLAEITAQRYGERTAVIACHQNKKMSFRDLLDEADRLAAGFSKLGFQKGDKIGLWAPNLAEWYVAYVACARGGFVAVLMNPNYKSFEIQNLIRKVGIKGLICGDRFRKQDYYDLLNEICPEISVSEHGEIYSDSVPTLRNVVQITSDNKKGTYRYSDILNMADSESISHIRRNQDQINFEDVCNIQFTSGTTGNPKAPMQSHFNIVNNGYYTGKATELCKKHHKICLQNPLFHAFGTIITLSAALNHGSTIVLPNDVYDPEKNLTAIAQEKCTIIFGTPTMYVDLVEQQRKRNEDINLEIALSGGSICPSSLFENMLDVLKVKKVKSVYGLTETTASVFMSQENDSVYQATNTVGKVIEQLEVKVVDNEGKIVPFGVPGELHVRGYGIMMGYYQDEEKTKEIIDTNGWLRTGDKFILTEDGYGQVVGRVKDMIIRGGENVYPKEIEDFLLKHPNILEVQVVGVPHERLGEEVCAVVKTKNNCTITRDEIVYFCKGKMSTFKIPSVIKQLEYFPTTTSGKVQKHKIVEILTKNTTKNNGISC